MSRVIVKYTGQKIWDASNVLEDAKIIKCCQNRIFSLSLSLSFEKTVPQQFLFRIWNRSPSIFFLLFRRGVERTRERLTWKCWGDVKEKRTRNKQNENDGEDTHCERETLPMVTENSHVTRAYWWRQCWPPKQKWRKKKAIRRFLAHPTEEKRVRHQLNKENNLNNQR